MNCAINDTSPKPFRCSDVLRRIGQSDGAMLARACRTVRACEHNLPPQWDQTSCLGDEPVIEADDATNVSWDGTVHLSQKCRSACHGHAPKRTTPPSTRRAAPVVADACSEHR